MSLNAFNIKSIYNVLERMYYIFQLKILKKITTKHITDKFICSFEKIPFGTDNLKGSNGLVILYSIHQRGLRMTRSYYIILKSRRVTDKYDNVSFIPSSLFCISFESLPQFDKSKKTHQRNVILALEIMKIDPSKALQSVALTDGIKYVVPNFSLPRGRVRIL